MKRPNIVKIIFIVLITALTFVAISCSTSKGSTNSDLELGELGSFNMEKSGAVLWGENCNRCHNSPDPAAFSDEQWKAIGTHMRIRAGLTADDAKKIIEFLQQSN